MDSSSARSGMVKKEVGNRLNKIISKQLQERAVGYVANGLAIAMHPDVGQACTDPRRLLWRLEGEIGMLKLLGIAPEETEKLSKRLALCKEKLDKEKAPYPAATR